MAGPTQGSGGQKEMLHHYPWLAEGYQTTPRPDAHEVRKKSVAMTTQNFPTSADGESAQADRCFAGSCGLQSWSLSVVS